VPNLIGLTAEDSYRDSYTPGRGTSGPHQGSPAALGEPKHVRRLADGETMSAKQRKAHDLRATGRDIQLIGEDDFLRAL